jgi:broad specificity phosphatase PhoE
MGFYNATDTQTTTAGRADLVVKLLAYALNDGAGEGEAQNAAARMVSIARRERVTFDRLSEHIAAGVKRLPPAPPKTPPAPDALFMEMPFGKYSGMSLRDIFRKDVRYLRWMAANMEDDFYRDAARDVLDWLTKGGHS